MLCPFSETHCCATTTFLMCARVVPFLVQPVSWFTHHYLTMTIHHSTNGEINYKHFKSKVIIFQQQKFYLQNLMEGKTNLSHQIDGEQRLLN